MPAPNTEHLLEQAYALAGAPAAGAPRQTDIRRAISSAYYAAFHATLAAVANHIVGVGQQGTACYSLVYRSIDHRDVKSLCDDLSKSTIPAKYQPYVPAAGFDQGLVDFATALAELQENRHAADYDPTARFRLSDAKVAIKAAQLAVAQLVSIPAEQLRTFVLLLAFPPHR